MNQDAIKPAETIETLADVPEHVLRGLPDEVKLAPSEVDKTRLGIWTRKQVPKGKKFGPFVGEKKKRSQVKNNVYMWEVYYPNLGWMCVDATDPQKGNWLRYVNWARSVKEQNLCPLEINRTIYYKTLKPIEPGEELLVWYNGEDNPEIAAAIEEERTASSNRSKRSSPKSRRGESLGGRLVTFRISSNHWEIFQPFKIFSDSEESYFCSDLVLYNLRYAFFFLPFFGVCARRITLAKLR
uniref:PR/SET domain 2 n=1 Tax=Leptobrachium leishanense TaxID=445787 RepID=A0A8C5N499_9ANUR